MSYPHYVALLFITWPNTFSKYCPTFHSELKCRWLRALQALRKIILRAARNSIFSHSCCCKIERRIIFHFMVEGSTIMISVICKITLKNKKGHGYCIFSLFKYQFKNERTVQMVLLSSLPSNV